MEKNRNRNINNYNIKIIVVVIAVFLMLILIALLIAIATISKKPDENGELSYDNFTTVKEVIEYHKSTYISEEKSKEANFYLDIYLKFGKLLYDEDEKNEEYYNKIIEDVAKILNYKSYIMLDKENDITIKVKCKNNKIEKITINDIEDYFIYMDSQISLKYFEEIAITKFDISSETLQRVVDNSWNSDTFFGARDSIYNQYYIYFSEGIKVKTVQNKIYNIVFDKKYSGSVINNLFPGISFDSVKAELGKPTFEDKENGIIGYKGEREYVFFSKDEISVYRITNEDTNDFFKLADEFINSNVSLLEFMNNLTYMWPDYSEYEYTATSVYLSYPLKGIEIKINYDDTDGILVYNNIRSTMSKVGRYLENTNFVSRLKLDCVFESERKRIEESSSEKERADEYISTLDEKQKDIIGESLKYFCYPEVDDNSGIYSMNFVSSTGDEPNRELNDNISEYIWISNDNFVYSKQGKGIYLYNLENGKVSRLVEGNSIFELKKYDNGILYYDNEKIEI